MKFEKGDNIVYILDTYICDYMTYNKTYHIIDIYPDYKLIMVVDDDGELSSFPPSFFISITEYRDNIINMVVD